MELSKNPVKFLCNAAAETFRVSVPKTENHYLFYKNQPYLVKFDLDIEFFDEHLLFDRAIDPEPEEPEEVNTPEENVESSDANEKEESPGDATQEETSKSEPEKEEISEPERKTYSKKELQSMRKSDVREILKELSPEKSCPIRKENMIKEVLKDQGSK